MGMLLALAMILSYVESLLPLTPGIPGIKVGLPNLIVVLLLGWDMQSATTDSGQWFERPVRVAAVINLLRIVLSGFLFGNLFAIIYSLSGAVCSFLAMLLGRRMRCFSLFGISVLGGVCHNIGQLLMASWVLKTQTVWYYLPVLLLAGTAMGAVLGIVAGTLLPYCRRMQQGNHL